MFKLILTAAAVTALLSAHALAADPGAGEAAAGPLTSGYEGYYAGLDFGDAQGTVSDGNVAFPDVATTGYFVGGQAGYNFVLIDGVVAGIEGDVNWSRESGKTDPMTVGPVTSVVSDSINFTAAFTGHVGVTMSGLMLYGLGGVAAAGSNFQDAGTDPAPFESDVTRTHYGWTAGAGISAMMGPISTFVEYRYADYGTADYSAAVGSAPVDIIDQSVRAGFNYHMH